MAAEGSQQPDLTALPTETLQVKAAEQRRRLHQTAADVREKIYETKQRLSLANQVREHLLTSLVSAGVIAGLIGFGFAGVFTRR